MPTADTLWSLLARAAEEHPDRPVMVNDDGAITYASLLEEAAVLSRGLVAVGVGKGSRIALLAGNTPFFVRALFACCRLGALLAPVSTLATPAELAFVLRHCDAQIVLVERRFAGRDYGDILRQALPALTGRHHGSALRIQDAPCLRSIWTDDTEGLEFAASMDALLSAGAADHDLDAAFLSGLSAQVTAADEGVIIYTSGSTAEPKAVVHCQGPMARHAAALAKCHFARPGERVLCVLPMFWVGGLGMLLETMANGGTVVLPGGASLPLVAEALRRHDVDFLHGWPAQRDTLRAMLQEEGIDFSRVRGLRDELLADGSPRAPDQAPNSLGMTETFGPHCASPVGSVLPDHRRGAFGPVLGGYERRTVDPETKQVLAPGVLGELQLRGGALMQGYYKRERAQVFTDDGFFPTSDLVRIEPDGFMYFAGRTGDMLKTKGANVSRLEVEAALRALDGVAQAVVCGLPDRVLGDRVVAAVVAAQDAVLTEIDMKEALRARLAAYKIPTDIILVGEDDLPWTPSGKIRLAEMAQIISAQLESNAVTQ